VKASRVLVVVVMALVPTAAACNDDGDSADPTLPPRSTTDPPVVSDPPVTTAPPTDPPTTPSPTTEAPTTTSAATTSTTTTAPTTTVFDEAALEAQIGADLIEANRRSGELVAAPTDVDLDANLATAAAGRLGELLRARILALVESGNRVVPGNPPYDEMTVDRVDWDASRPDEAWVLVCTVDNLQEVSGAPGSTVVVSGGELAARRFDQHVIRTPGGWLPDQFQETYLGLWRGEAACPAP